MIVYDIYIALMKIEVFRTLTVAHTHDYLPLANTATFATYSHPLAREKNHTNKETGSFFVLSFLSVLTLLSSSCDHIP